MDPKKVHKFEKNKTITWHALLKNKKGKKLSGLFFHGTARVGTSTSTYGHGTCARLVRHGTTQNEFWARHGTSTSTRGFL